MAWRARVLVVANVTATSDELVAALRERAERGPVAVTLLMPATGRGSATREADRARLDGALEAWRAAGLEADGIAGDQDPAVAVHEVWDPRRFDEVIVSTLPTGSSKWLQADLPQRVAKITDMPVRHVVAGGRAKPRTRSVRSRERSPLGALDLKAPRQR